MKRILLVVAALLAGASQALAQEGQIQPCDEKSPGNCVEVLVRYWENPPAGTAKVWILDAKTRKAMPTCQICDPKDAGCKSPCTDLAGTTVSDARTLLLMQSHKSPGCYYICSGGWCRWRCF